MSGDKTLKRIEELETRIKNLTDWEFQDLVTCYASVGMVEKALSYLEKEVSYRFSVKYCVANNVLGNWYYAGRYVQKDREKARKYYENAAYDGYVYAEYNMGRVHFDEGDYIAATIWFQAAADKGYLLALRMLAEAYFKMGGNMGIPCAIEFAEKAATRGDEKAAENLKRYRETARKAEEKAKEKENSTPWYAGSIEKIHESLGITDTKRDDDMLDLMTEAMGFSVDGTDG